MSACAPRSSVLAALLVVAGLSGPAAAEAPARVVSINLCTDQLAMMIAAPGQLLSVTWLARDPVFSAMADEAEGYPTNRGLAEEVYLYRPDLVLADQWSSADTIAILRRLGIPVVQFAPGESMAEIRANILKMGEALGRPGRAAELAAAFDARLAALRAEAGPRPRAATYGANAYASGKDSLSGQILDAAGYDNVATEFGIDYGGTLPLEVLVMARPDLVVMGDRDPGVSRSEDILRHPALAGLRAEAAIGDSDWTCGTPFILDAVERLVGLRTGGG